MKKSALLYWVLQVPLLTTIPVTSYVAPLLTFLLNDGFDFEVSNSEAAGAGTAAMSALASVTVALIESQGLPAVITVTSSAANVLPFSI